ncbi:uncharacterized protein [Procambarus clarkii]|uniref:uncharacterized protein n=1 Tax=Procambarus clarkii TaxID=6728 RepID=UPI001E676A00|nr:uncharacterized protein LOC123773930 [Procambarus clarkii]
MDLRWPGCIVFVVGALYLVLGVCPLAQAIGDRRQCYNFTWPGVNETIDCEDKINDMNDNPIPCVYPLVYTTPFESPPDISALESHCRNTTCPVFKCSTKGSNCIKYSWFDINDRMVNYSLFCGTVADNTNADTPIVKTSGCWKQRMGTYTREMCVCDYDLCNMATRPTTGVLLLLLLPLAAQTVARAMLTTAGHVN